jgi:hypothetical protein
MHSDDCWNCLLANRKASRVPRSRNIAIFVTSSGGKYGIMSREGEPIAWLLDPNVPGNTLV